MAGFAQALRSARGKTKDKADATALFLGACLLASAAVGAGNQPMLVASYIFGGTGFVLMVHLFFTVRKDG